MTGNRLVLTEVAFMCGCTGHKMTYITVWLIPIVNGHIARMLFHFVRYSTVLHRTHEEETLSNTFEEKVWIVSM